MTPIEIAARSRLQPIKQVAVRGGPSLFTNRGLGNYTELAIWKCAASDTAYKPVQALSGDRDFNGYRNFSGKWAQELITLRLQSHGTEIRFYYSGMAQAFLLDRLNSDWKTTILQGNVFLEDLLSEALTNRRQ